MMISILTVCPELFEGFLNSHTIRRAGDLGMLKIQIVDIRSFADGCFRKVDDSPYGGGRGMILRVEPVLRAIRAVSETPLRSEESELEGAPKAEEPEEPETTETTVGSEESELEGTAEAEEPGEPETTETAVGSEEPELAGAEAREPAAGAEISGKIPGRNVSGDKICVAALTPIGETYTQEAAQSFLAYDHLILVCGHYEGMDARIYQHADRLISIGDFVLSGGEIPAMAVGDSLARLLPGVLKEGSLAEESFSKGLLEYPQYTRPANYHGEKVPEVLLSGNHEAIAVWRREQAVELTRRFRPDLMKE